MKTLKDRVAKAQSLIARQSALDTERLAIEAELESLLGGSTVATPGKKRGPKPGSKRKTKRATKASKKGSSKKSTRGRRAKSKDGRSINDVLIQDVLPARGEEGMDLTGAFAALKKKGIDSTEGSVRQSLMTLANDKFALRVDRGQYTLSAKGEKIRANSKGAAKPKRVPKKKAGKPAKKKTTKKQAESKPVEQVNEVSEETSE